MRSELTALISASVVASSFIIATPASAAVLPPVTVDCTASALTLSANNFAAARFDTIDITNSTGGQFTSISAFGFVKVSGSADFTNGETWNYEVRLNTGANITFTTTGGSCGGQSITLTVTGSGGGSSSGTSSASAPTPIVQQFGKPDTSTCEETAPESLNWAGVASGGWGESWAQWMNGGLGGPVCTRTLVYSTAQSRWIVG
jgi:hypothetical protein